LIWLGQIAYRPTNNTRTHPDQDIKRVPISTSHIKDAVGSTREYIVARVAT